MSRTHIIKQLAKLYFTISLIVFAGLSSEAEAQNVDRDIAANKSSAIGGQLKRSALPTSALKKEEAKARSLGKVKPPKSNNFVDQNGKEAEYERLLDKEIRAIYKLSQQTKSSSNRGEIWLRLAERYVEKARLVEFREQASYDLKVKAFLEKKTRVKPKLDIGVIREYNRKAIQLYEWFIKDFPNDPKIDQALFFLGYNNFELSNTKKGEEYYKQLITRYPDSVYVTESYFALGEFYFENEQWKIALENYLKVIEAKRARLASFAYYKAAWCLYRLNRTSDSLKYLERVVRMSKAVEMNQDVAGRKNINKIRLAVEALKDYVPFYSEGGDVEKAYDNFNRVAGDERAAQQMLERLAYLLADQGSRTHAANVFHQLITFGPTGERAAEYQYQIVLAYSTSDQKEFRRQLEVWLQFYGPQSAWAQENKKNQKLVSDVARLQESTVRNHVLQLHQTAQNSRARFSQDLAHAAYQLYVKHFSDSEKIVEMQFYHAELLFDMQRFEEAAALYSYAADRDPKGPFRERAMLNAVLALEKELPGQEKIEEKRGKSIEPIGFEPKVAKFEQAAAKYLGAYPKGEKRADIERRLGVLYYSYNQFEKAIPVFEKSLFASPGSENGEIAGNLVLDIYKLKNDMVGLADKGQQYLSVPAIASSKFGAQIRAMMERAGYARAEKLASAGDFKRAATEFESFTGMTKNPELILAARYKAAESFEKVGDVTNAAKNYLIVLATPVAAKDTRGQSLQTESRNALAKIYELTGQLDLAAKQYGIYASANVKDPKAVNGFFNAAVIFEGLGQLGDASENFQKYRDHSKRPDRTETLFNEAEMWRRAKNDKKAAQYYQAYLDSGTGTEAKRIEAIYRLADSARLGNLPTKAAKLYSQVLSLYKTASPLGREAAVKYVAESRFQIAQAIKSDLLVVKFGSTDASQGAAVKQIQSLIKKYLDAMKEVVRADYGPMIVASLASTGQFFDIVAEKFDKVPTPQGLVGEQAQKYHELIQVESNKFRNEAKNSYKTAVDRSLEFETYGDWTQIARKGLAKYDPQVSAKTEMTLDANAGDWMGL